MSVTDHLRDQAEEYAMLQRIDQELSTTLDFDKVLALTIDWALRRTGATAGAYLMVSSDGTGMQPLVWQGFAPSERIDSLSVTQGVSGRAVRLKEPQLVRNVALDPDYIAIRPDTVEGLAVPLELRGAVIGVIWLESDRAETFDESDLAFIRRLASRAAVALDHARLYREAEAQADNMAALYAANRMISSSLERADVLTNAAQSLATLLHVSSVVVCDYRPERRQITVVKAYHLPTARNAPDILPPLDTVFYLDELPELREALQTHHAVAFNSEDWARSDRMRAFMRDHRCKSMLCIPLITPGSLVQPNIAAQGVAFAFEGRRERHFTAEEIEMAEALGGQIAAALRQARLYADVRELETLKSEMIRMASHDLRNPLGNVMGYLELLISEIGLEHLPAQQREWVGHIRRSLQQMKILIDDLLTLEKVESERQSLWNEVNFGELVQQEVDGLASNAALKGHTLNFSPFPAPMRILGSATQLRQAVNNLIGNAIKYTPDKGMIQVRLMQKDKRLIFEVQDNGYGISKERQARLFSRFYRAHEPGTDHIGGTGLGLSLVKTIIERHGGEVWVHSEPGIGSTFGFWLPAAAP